MPFDNATTRRPSVTVLPPTPPEHGGDPRRIRIDIAIEIVDRRQQSPRGYRFGTFTLVLFALLLLAALAHAQPTSWQSYPQGFTRQYQGTDAAGGQWTGSSYRSGFMTYFDANGPDGQQQHCRSYELSGTVHTDCDR